MADGKGGSRQGRQAGTPGPELGSLEEQVMNAAWSAGGDLSIREVWERLRVHHPVTFNTVMTVMNRLVRKGLLVRRGIRGSYTYAPARSRSEYAAALARRVNRDLVARFGPAAIAGFVDSLDEVSPGYLEALERFVQERTRGRDASRDDAR